MITHLTQPTRTSCGPTCVAMITGFNFNHVLHVLQVSRGDRRKKIKWHSMNVAEMTRVLAAFNRDVDRRIRVEDMTDSGDEYGLLRVHEPRKSGNGHRASWHWCIIANGVIHDPLMTCGIDQRTWFHEAKDHKIFFYAVTRRKG